MTRFDHSQADSQLTGRQVRAYLDSAAVQKAVDSNS